MRFFNTAGPVRCEDHYCLPPLERLDLDEVLMLIAQKKYFVLHAPRQTGKTTCLLALMDYLNERGEYRALYANFEVAQGTREDVYEGARAMLTELGESESFYLKSEHIDSIWPEILERHGGYAALGVVLSRWCVASEKPTVLFIDEIDSLVGDTLIAVLRQLRAGYPKRPEKFPQSIILCGVRDVRDYRIHSDREKSIITGGSAFNVKAESLKLGSLNPSNVTTLLRQHTDETGQRFEEGVPEYIFELTAGQPWLVNALAYEACFGMKGNRNQAVTITNEIIARAKENLILSRATHLDQLADKLKEERVRRVIEPIVSGGNGQEPLRDEDTEYVSDLGLITVARNGEIAIANAIYREVIPRSLSWNFQLRLTEKPEWYVHESGELDTNGLLKAFQSFFRQHSEHWMERFDYKEAGPQLLLQAFLQRIVNGGGRVEREYGMGRGRTDLFLIWPHPAGVQKVVLELKIRRNEALETVIDRGLDQTADYMDTCGADEGHLILFDRNASRSWDEKIFHRAESRESRRIEIWGM